MAESLLNPFGDDDENFCVDFLIDRNLQVGILQNLTRILIEKVDNLVYFSNSHYHRSHTSLLMELIVTLRW